MVSRLGPPGGPVILGGALLLLASGFCIQAFARQRERNRPALEKSPSKHWQLPEEGACYRKDAIPGGRSVETPYGIIRVYEWGPEDGEKVLLIHGISAPALTVSGLADELALKGHRVLIFGMLKEFSIPDASLVELVKSVNADHFEIFLAVDTLRTRLADTTMLSSTPPSYFSLSHLHPSLG